jgi:2-polyprenyl-3-methyl-5-hydroxy-6-metoxy-1,4-benzoquinol methylase
MITGPTHYHQSVILGDDDLLQFSTSCPWCGGTERRAIATIQLNPEVLLLECIACMACSASRMPKPQSLDSYYAGYYDCKSRSKVTSAKSPIGRVTIGDTAKMGMHLARCFNSSGGKTSIRILDFGGGDGLLAALAAENLLVSNSGMREVSISVVDYNIQMHQPANHAIKVERYAQLDELPDGVYDFVIASAILEHIPECASVLRQILSRVASGGSLYIRTPFAAPFMRAAEILGKSWDFTFPAHVHDLGQNFWERFFTTSGLDETFDIKSSRPSIVQASMGEHPFEALASHIFKLPWYFLGKAWPFVGGWEVTVVRK